MKATAEYPLAINRLVATVCVRDREFFEAHPDVEVYQRPYVPGEFYPVTFTEPPTTTTVYGYPPVYGLRLRMAGDAAMVDTDEDIPEGLAEGLLPKPLGVIRHTSVPVRRSGLNRAQRRRTRR